MGYLIAILISLALFGAFLALTYLEERRGVRLLATRRYQLDKKVLRAHFIATHVDWGAFVLHTTRTSMETLAHDAAHGTLLAVRWLERVLTRLVRALRTRRAAQLPESGGVPPRLAESTTMVSLRRNIRRWRKEPPTQE